MIKDFMGPRLILGVKGKGIHAERVKRGALKFLVLEGLAKKPMYSYQIMKAIERRTGGLYSPSPGALYPVLKQMVDSGLVSVSVQNGKKVYSLTEKGVRHYKEVKERVRELFVKRKNESNPRRALMSKLFELGVLVYNVSKSVDRDRVTKIMRVLERCEREIGEILNDNQSHDYEVRGSDRDQQNS